MTRSDLPQEYADDGFWDALDAKFLKEHPEHEPAFNAWFQKSGGMDKAIADYATFSRVMAYKRGYEDGSTDLGLAKAAQENG